MRLASRCCSLVVWLASVATAFSPEATSLWSRPSSCLSNVAHLPMSSTDDDDGDWYADYDPAIYDQYNHYQRRRNYNNNRHGYSRDTSRDQSNVDVEAVQELLAERLDARKRRDYDYADEIRSQLLQQYSVGVDDREKTWRTGCSTSGSGMKRGGGYRSSISRYDTKRRRPLRDFGPKGHDYKQSHGPNISSLSDEEIDALLAQRLKAKLNRDFDTADDIQLTLRDAGVLVHDGIKEWRADGIMSFMNGRNRSYEKSKYSMEATEEEDTIQDLVDERSQCKAIRDFERADSIREELVNTYNVFVDDRLKQWSIGGDFGNRPASPNKSRPISKSAFSAELANDADEAYVQTKVEERQEARRVGDYDLADSIREELLNEFDVTIDDRLRQWSVGGNFGGSTSGSSRSYTRRGGGNLSEQDVTTITSMIAERAKAKRDGNFNVADDIRDHLRETFRVTIDDWNREWRVDSDEYVQSPLCSTELSEEDIFAIQSKVEERATMKRAKNYDAADAIRDELRDNYSVLIDDRTREWSISETDGSDKFASDAMMSQTSAFKRKQIDEDLDDALMAILESDADIIPDDSDRVEVTEDDTMVNVVPGEATGSSLSREDLMSLTVVVLKEKLREAGKPVSGRKAELVERLLSS